MRRDRSCTTEDRDPQETTNLYGERQPLADRMITQLRSMESGFAKTQAALPAASVDPEARQRLAALGYVGSFVATAADSRTGRADPKDKIDLFNKLGEATELTKEVDEHGRPPFTRITAILNGIVAQDPQVIDAWFMLGTQHMAHDDLEAAVGYFKHTLELKPDYDLAVFNLAQAYRRMGNDDAALAGFEHYLTLDPKDPFVEYQMGEIWLDRGDVPRAEALFRKALEMDPQVAAAKNALGVIALQRGDVDGADRMIHEALATKPNLRLAHFNLGLVAEQRGDMRTAEREYFEELKAHPDNFKAAFNMSRLYEQVGDREGQIGALKQSIVSNPNFPEGHIFLAKAYLDSGAQLRRRDPDGAQGPRARAALPIRPARPLRAGRRLQPPGPRRRQRARRDREVARTTASGRAAWRSDPVIRPRTYVHKRRFPVTPAPVRLDR